MDPTVLITTTFMQGLILAVGFVVFLVLGAIIAWIAGLIIRKLSAMARLEKYIEEAGLKEALLGFTLTDLIAWTTELYILLLTLAIGGDWVKLSSLTQWSMAGLLYLSSAVQGLAILVVGLFIGEYISDRIKESGIFGAGFWGILTEIFIAYNALVLALPAILPEVDTSLLKWSFMLFIGAVLLALAIAGGIAFGFGLNRVIEKISLSYEKDIEEAIFGKSSPSKTNAGGRARGKKRRR